MRQRFVQENRRWRSMILVVVVLIFMLPLLWILSLIFMFMSLRVLRRILLSTKGKSDKFDKAVFGTISYDWGQTARMMRLEDIGVIVRAHRMIVSQDSESIIDQAEKTSYRRHLRWFLVFLSLTLMDFVVLLMYAGA